VVSPSKRATAEPASTEQDEHARASGNGAGGNGDHASSNGDASPTRAPRPAPPRSRAKRRSTPAGGASAPSRGTSSQRGASSSSITKRVAAPAPPTAAAPADVETAARLAPPTPGPSLDAPIVLPATTPTVEPPPVVLPAVTQPVAPVERGATARFPETIVVPRDPPRAEPPPYGTTAMSSHTVAPVPRVVGRRPRVRKVTRVVRHVDPWSVFKIALVFNIVLYVVLLTAGVLLWNVAYATGTIDNLERFFESFGWSEFEFDGGAIYHSAWVAGLFGVVGLTGAAVLAATLFNLITDLVGGVRLTVLEEEVVERTASPMRRFVVRRPNGAETGFEEPRPSNLPSRTDVGG
jgi:hypothetical protein